MRIGLDVDGVLINQEKYQLKKGISFFKKQYIKEYYKNNKIKLKSKDIQVQDIVTGKDFYTNKDIDLTKPYITIDSNGYGIKDVFMCGVRDEEKFWYRYMAPYAFFAPFRKDASRIINQLHSEGHQIYPVTSRAKANEKNIIGLFQRAVLTLRLKLNKIPYEKITYCSYKDGLENPDKIKACIDNELDLMIEDKKSIAEAIEENTNTQTFLYSTRHNADIANKNILRFVNFSELYNGIRKHYEKEQFVTLSREEKEKLSKEDLQKYYKMYRDYHTKYVYDKEVAAFRAEKLKRSIRRLRFVFDRKVKHRVINSAKIPKEKGIIITTNHRDMLDIPLIMRVVGERPYNPMLKSEFLDTKVEGYFTERGCIFVKRNDKSIREQSRETAVKRVLSGHDVVICPEGTRNKTKNPLLDFDFGAVSIARNSGKPIYPCAIYHGPKRRVVNFGNPIHVPIDADLAEVNKQFFEETLRLLKECEMEEDCTNNHAKQLKHIKRVG